MLQVVNYFCWPGEIRTHNPPVKSRVHLPVELRAKLCCDCWIRTNNTYLVEIVFYLWIKSHYCDDWWTRTINLYGISVMLSTIELSHHSLRLRDSNLHLRLMRPSSYRYSKPQFISVGLTRFELASLRSKHSILIRWTISHHCATSRFELKTITCDLPFRKKGKWPCCLLHQAAFSLLYSLLTTHHCSLVDSGLRTLFFRCTDGCFTDKLKPTSQHVTGFRIELKTPDSNSGMLPITQSGSLSSMSDSNTLPRFGRPAHSHQCICCIYFPAVRTGIEPIATDRQSVMLAFTPTNLVICMGIEPIFQEWKSCVLTR